ncbi:MAG: thermonuclease family protein [Solirubrobacterales bacterium]
MRPAGTVTVVIGLAATAIAVAAPAVGPGAQGARAADRDCSDFPNQRAAQTYFISRGGPRRDPDHLDSDGDGVACETLPCPCRGSSASPGGSKRRIKGRIDHVTDGDTVSVAVHRRRVDVRLIGIDTPEKYGGRECGSAGASRSMRRMARAGTRVTLVTDSSQDLHDRYGRLLAYVVRRRDGRDLGRSQVARGWAKVYVFERPFRRLRAYRRSARRARRADRGVWGRCGGDFHHPLRVQ